MLLESFHKVRENTPNTEPCQDVVPGNVSGKGLRDAMEKAEGWSTNMLTRLMNGLMVRESGL